MTAFKRSQARYTVDALIGDVVASGLTSKGVRDASRLPALLRQVERSLATVCADGAYDKTAVYEIIESHNARVEEAGVDSPG